MGTIYITGNTFFKRTPSQSSTLSIENKIFLNSGSTIHYTDGSLKNTGEHYQVETVDQVAPWGRIGFLYVSHVQLEIDGFTSKLVRLVRPADSYRSILSKAERLRGGEDNTCVAFQSEALRMAGIPVPIKDTADGNISLVTKPYARWLIENLAPERITDLSKLQPGDLCFSLDERGFPGFPAHTYIFSTYFSNSHAYVIDNQGNNYVRNLINYAPKTPFAYALRIHANHGFSQQNIVNQQETPQDYYDVSGGIRNVPEQPE